MSELDVLLRVRRLRHIVMRDETEILGKTQLVEVQYQDDDHLEDPGILVRKTFSRNLQEKEALDRYQWQLTLTTSPHKK